MLARDCFGIQSRRDENNGSHTSQHVSSLSRIARGIINLVSWIIGGFEYMRFSQYCDHCCWSGRKINLRGGWGGTYLVPYEYKNASIRGTLFAVE